MSRLHPLITFKMWLLIDDRRYIACEAIARTPAAARRLLKLECCDSVVLDHDLGAEELGYDILVWALDEKCVPDRVVLISSNPVGCERMQPAFLSVGFRTADGLRFRR